MVTPLRPVNKVSVALPDTGDQALTGEIQDTGGPQRLKAELLSAVTAALETAEAEGLLGRLSSAGGGLDEKEQWILELRHLLSAKIAGVCLTQERGYSGARKVCQCGRKARYVRDDPKTYVTLVGELELRRAEYSCPSCGAWRPLEEQWDLPEGHFTRGVVRLAATVGGALPFERAAEVLRELSGIGISASQVRRLAERVGEEIGRQEALETEQFLGNAMPLPEPPAVLVVALDGAHVNTREGGWKETKVAAVARCEWTEKAGKRELRQTAVDYAALVGPPEPFGCHAYALSQRMGGRGQECTIVLGDGAPWIWNQVSEHFPGAVEVLDFYHLAEHVHGTAKALFVSDEIKAKDWAETILELLRSEEIEAALQYLRLTGETAQDLIA